MKKKSGWSGGGLFGDNPFTEASFEWLDAAEIEPSDEFRELAWKSLQNVDVDAVDRKLIWSDGERLSIEESAQRIHQECSEFLLGLIEEKVIVWLEGVYAPKSHSRAQLDELDRLTEAWIDDHDRARKLR